jgi:hypothetical protein
MNKLFAAMSFILSYSKNNKNARKMILTYENKVLIFYYF